MTNKLPVNVISVKKAKESLAKLLVRFRTNQRDHLIFGDQGQPEAVIIPFSDYRQFLRYEAEAEARAQNFDTEVSRRITEENSLPMESVEEFAAMLGPAGRDWASNPRNADDVDSQDEGTTHRGDRR